MLIDEYDVQLTTPDCDLESPIYAARVDLPLDIGEVLPFVNATVEKGEFIPGIPVLVWREGSHKYALRPREIAISNITDKYEANKLAGELVARVNRIWEDRESIEPSYASFEKPKVLDVYKLLPRTNCKECGAPTCMAFADALAKGKGTLEDCPAVNEPACTEQLTSLREMGL